MHFIYKIFRSGFIFAQAKNRNNIITRVNKVSQDIKFNDNNITYFLIF